MAQAQVIPKLAPPQVVEGTPKEIAAHLKQLAEDEQLTLIIPGKELQPTAEPTPQKDMTFTQSLAPAEKGFEESGMTEEELDEFIEAEVKAYRAEKRAKASMPMAERRKVVFVPQP